MFAYAGGVQLSFDAADRLVELIEERRGPVAVEEAARRMFALASTPDGLARTLLEDVVSGDARLAWRGGGVGLVEPPGAAIALEDAVFAVVDLETTGLSPGRSRICEVGAVRIRALEVEAELQTLVNPRAPLPAAVASLTGITDPELRHAPSAEWAVRRFLAFAGDAVLVAHNARFDLAFLDREVERLSGRRLAAPVVDTVSLARRLLAGRAGRYGLASLSHFFGTAVRPCHRALPDAQATAEILLALIGLAQERGARSVADLCALAVPRARRVYGKRSLAFGAPQRPGVYLFRGAGDHVLYVGRARDLRARLRSYFRSERQRPSVEAALAAVERIEWHVLGSELEAALEELRLIRELRPPANARGGRPQSYLRRRGERWVVVREPTRFGPVASKRRAQLAARALDDFDGDDLAQALPPLRAKLHRLARDLRFEDAARLRDRVAALEVVAERVAELDRLRGDELCVLAPARGPGFWRAFVLAGGRVVARTVPRGAAGRLEIQACLASAATTEPSLQPEDAADLLVVSAFVRRPPPELRIVPLRLSEILAA